MHFTSGSAFSTSSTNDASGARASHKTRCESFRCLAILLPVLLLRAVANASEALLTPKNHIGISMASVHNCGE